MDTNTKPVADAAEKPKSKRLLKIGTKLDRPAKAAKAEKAPKSEKAAEPKVNFHVAAGLDTSLYAGLSSYVNANRKVAVRQDVTATVTDMTTRMQGGLYALRKAYGEKPWRAKGFDNGILAHLASAGLIEFSGGQVQTIDGHPKLLDAEQPVVAVVTKAGMEYGKA